MVVYEVPNKKIGTYVLFSFFIFLLVVRTHILLDVLFSRISIDRTCRIVSENDHFSNSDVIYRTETALFLIFSAFLSDLTVPKQHFIDLGRRLPYQNNSFMFLVVDYRTKMTILHFRTLFKNYFKAAILSIWSSYTVLKQHFWTF